MALQDYVKDDQYDNKDHRNEGKSIRDPYLRHENEDHEQVNNRNKVNDLMSVRTEDKSRKKLFRRLLRVLAIILFLGMFICLTVFFFIYDFDKSTSDDVILVGNSNITTVPSNTVDSTSVPDDNSDITSVPEIKVTSAPTKIVTPAPAKNTTSGSTKTSNVKKKSQPTNQQMYFYDNFSRYDNRYQYGDLSKYDYNYQYQNPSRYDYNYQYQNPSRYDKSFQYEDLFRSKGKNQYTDYYADNRNGQRFNEISHNDYSYNEPQVSFPESFKQRAEKIDNSSKKSYPVIGEKAYNDYLEKNLRKLPDNACGGNYGKLILMFKVDPKGRPFDIAVLRSLCKSVDEEAIRLLKEGSDWTACDNYARLEIIF